MGCFFCTPICLAHAVCGFFAVFASPGRKPARVYCIAVLLWFYPFLPELLFPDAKVFAAEKVPPVYSFYRADWHCLFCPD